MLNKLNRVLFGLFTMTLAFVSLTACMDNNIHKTASLDKYEYISTTEKPTTITVIDPYTKQELWRMDIPVNHTLTLQLDRQGDMAFMRTGRLDASSLHWQLYGPGSNWFSDAVGSMDLQQTPVLIKYSLRPAPEYPAQYVPQDSVDANKLIKTANGKKIHEVKPVENGQKTDLTPSTNPENIIHPDTVPATQPSDKPLPEIEPPDID